MLDREVEERWLPRPTYAGSRLLERASSNDERFQNAPTTRRFLDDLEEREGDKPRALAQDLETLRAAGLSSVSAVWVEYREAVMVGIKR